MDLVLNPVLDPMMALLLPMMALLLVRCLRMCSFKNDSILHCMETVHGDFAETVLISFAPLLHR